MAKCAYCNTGILFGGVKDGEARYCNEQCHATGYFVSLADQVDPATVNQLAREVQSGPCPRCKVVGSPVDVYKDYRIWSLLILTSWSSRPAISCKSCATKRQIGSIFYCAFLGWWGFPWGFLGTPIQIFRNLTAMLSGPKSGQPSPLLMNHLKVNMGQQIAQEIHSQQASAE